MTGEPQGLPDGLRDLGRTLVFGVLNVTPDSFSDGGAYPDAAAAVAAGLALHAAGADVVDVGGESTRPGAVRVTVAEERARVLPVVTALAAAGIPVSIDTMRADVAATALSAGAVIVNDVSGGLADPEMLPMMADTAAPYILMHWRAHGADMDARAVYTDVVTDVVAELRLRLDACDRAGVARERIVLDPGLGFAKTSDHNWELLHGLEVLDAMGLPIMLGASRKRFIGALLASPEGPRDVAEREAATAAVTAIAAAAGVWAVRVHDPRANADAVRVAAAWRRGHG